MTKGEAEKELHKKSLERINLQVEALRKEVIEAKRSETKMREELFSETLKSG